MVFSLPAGAEVFHQHGTKHIRYGARRSLGRILELNAAALGGGGRTASKVDLLMGYASLKSQITSDKTGMA